MLTDAGDHYTAAGPLPQVAIPETLRASLLARLDRLATVREVAQIGAALGRRFSHEMIGAMAAMPPAQLDDALAQLVAAELIYRRGTPPDADYIFKHALVQDAAYDALLRSRRQQLHARIAGTLEGRFPEIVAAQPALLAHHCTEAGLTEKAVEYLLAAGRQAWGRSMLAEAIALFRRGLALVPALPDTYWCRYWPDGSASVRQHHHCRRPNSSSLRRAGALGSGRRSLFDEPIGHRGQPKARAAGSASRQAAGLDCKRRQFLVRRGISA
jgi:hypothetical protein